MKALQLRWNMALGKLRRLRRAGSYRGALPTTNLAPRLKAHVDFCVDEARWVAQDMHEERKWKVSVAKVLAAEAGHAYASGEWKDPAGKLQRRKAEVRGFCDALTSLSAKHKGRVVFAQRFGQKDVTDALAAALARGDAP